MLAVLTLPWSNLWRTVIRVNVEKRTTLSAVSARRLRSRTKGSSVSFLETNYQGPLLHSPGR
jgi:hypothetical protein